MSNYTSINQRKLRYEAAFSSTGQTMKGVVIDRLGDYFTKYERIEQLLNKKRVTFMSLLQFLSELHSFLRAYLSKAENAAYHKAGKIGPSTSMVKSHYNDLTKHTLQLSYLRQLLYDLVQHRLDDCFQPESNQPVRYNLRIEYIRKKETLNHCVLLLPKTLAIQYVRGIKRAGKKTYLVEGVRLDGKWITCTTVTATTLTDQQVLLYKQKHDLLTDPAFTMACQDATAEIYRAIEEAGAVVPAKERTPQSEAPVFPGFPPSSLAKPSAVVTGMINHLIRGMDHLQTQGEGNDAYRLVQSGNGDREHAVRNFFHTFFKGRYEVADIELHKGLGRIDLVVVDTEHQVRVKMEFKGWWSQHKNGVAGQLLGYMTDFEGTGFVIMINDTGKDISNLYQQLIVQRETGFVPGSWRKITYAGSSYVYYCSEHQEGSRIIQLWHFILSIPRK